MKKFLAVTLLLCCLFTACSDNDKSESISSEIPSVAEGEAGELITPDEDSDEYSLGEYRYSSDGTKLYYNESEYSTELILTLEKYFKSFEENNYEIIGDMLYGLQNAGLIDSAQTDLNERGCAKLRAQIVREKLE